MRPEIFLNDLRRLGVVLWNDGSLLHYRARVGVMTPELRIQLAEQKAGIVELLQNEPASSMMGSRKVPQEALAAPSTSRLSADPLVIDRKPVKKIVLRSERMVWFVDTEGNQWRYFASLEQSFPVKIIQRGPPLVDYWQDPINRNLKNCVAHWPWPWVLPESGEKSVGDFQPCGMCGSGTWVRYGKTAICLWCAKAVASFIPRPSAGYIAWCHSVGDRLPGKELWEQEEKWNEDYFCAICQRTRSEPGCKRCTDFRSQRRGDARVLM
jgi:hypothetical protein